MPKRSYAGSVVSEGTARSKRSKATATTQQNIVRYSQPMRPGGFPSGTVPEELKFVDLPLATYACSTTGSVTLLNGVAQGTDYNQRVGRQMLLKSVELRGYAYADADGSSDLQYVRVMVVLDNATNGAAPIITDILTAQTSISMPNLANRGRFRILSDQRHAFEGAITAAGVGPKTMNCDLYLRWPKGIVVQNNGTAATVGSIQSGALWLVTIGSSGSVNQNASAQLCTRVRFTDP